MVTAHLQLVKVCLHVTVLSPSPLLPLLGNEFFLLSSEYQRENGSITYSVCYSRHQYWNNAKLLTVVITDTLRVNRPLCFYRSGTVNSKSFIGKVFASN